MFSLYNEVIRQTHQVSTTYLGFSFILESIIPLLILGFLWLRSVHFTVLTYHCTIPVRCCLNVLGNQRRLV